jgi:hypothetical protein
MDNVTGHPWPDSLDALALVSFLAVAIALPVLGYVFAVIDFRRYLRSLRRAISTIVYRDMGTPEWARPKIPRCVAAMGLDWPCSEEALTQAYRRKVKALHPDRGGDERRFRQLQRSFEEALSLVRALDPAPASGAAE